MCKPCHGGFEKPFNKSQQRIYGAKNSWQLAGINALEFIRNMMLYNKLLISGALLLAIQTVAALSLSIPKSFIDLAVAKKFPKEKLTITLDQPELNYLHKRLIPVK